MPLPRQLAAALCLLASPAMTLAATSPAADLNCRFQAQTTTGGGVQLTFTLENRGLHDLQLLRWGSPFEGGWFGPFVRVQGPLGDLPDFKAVSEAYELRGRIVFPSLSTLGLAEGTPLRRAQTALGFSPLRRRSRRADPGRRGDPH